MNGAIDSAVNQRLFDFPDEQAFATFDFTKAFLTVFWFPVSRRFDDHALYHQFRMRGA